MGNDLIFSMTYAIKSVSKQRPRSARGGHFYTPKKTREFERKIRELAEALYEDTPAAFPVRVDITITEVPPKSWPKWKKAAAYANKISPNRGDLDNKEKAIYDALNGVVYIDDVQVNNHSGVKQFGSENCIHVRVYRNGLTLEEAREWWHEQNNTSSTRVGG